MSYELRIILIIVSLLTTVYVLRKIRKSQLQIDDSIFWIGFSLALLVISIFPQIAISASRLIGIISPVNFVFLFTIFLLLVKAFFLSIKLSQVEHKFQSFVQEYAIKEQSRDTQVSVMSNEDAAVAEVAATLKKE